MAEQLLGHVALRDALRGRKDLIRDNIPRDTPWQDVHRVWQSLANDIPMAVTTAPAPVGAYTTLKNRLHTDRPHHPHGQLYGDNCKQHKLRLGATGAGQHNQVAAPA